MNNIPHCRYLRKSSLVTAGFVLLGALSIGEAETLTGIVKQPEAPHLPAPASTVIVYEKGTNKKLAGPDTTNKDGRYRYIIRSGTEVVVKASWKAERSSPGVTEKKVAQSPTEADVQLLPAKTAPPETWMVVGQESPALSAGTAAEVLRSLRESGVPAESMYSYVFGARKKAPSVYKALDKTELFTTLAPERVIDAIKAAEDQYRTESTVPNYQQLKLKETQLTEIQHTELLGFIATSKEPKDKKWNAALERAVGAEHKEQVLEEKRFISKTLFDTKAMKESTDFDDSIRIPDSQ
jgi:hypothetical protein